MDQESNNLDPNRQPPQPRNLAPGEQDLPARENLFPQGQVQSPGGQQPESTPPQRQANFPIGPRQQPASSQGQQPSPPESLGQTQIPGGQQPGFTPPRGPTQPPGGQHVPPMPPPVQGFSPAPNRQPYPVGPGPQGYQQPPGPPPYMVQGQQLPPQQKPKKKKTVIIAVSAIVVVLLLVAAAVILYFTTCLFGNHEFKAADCNNPEICSKCEKTQGEPLGHEWQDANCQKPKTCSVCDETEGTVGEHAWQEADCDKPKTCTVCGETEGAPTEHVWEDANCQQPKKCTLCGATEGEVGDHVWEGGDCETPATCSVCGIQGEKTDHDWQEANYQAPKTCSLCGQTEGTPIMPDFVANNITTTPLEEFETEDYRTICYENTSYATHGYIIVKNYVTYSDYPDLEIPEAPPGYEWRNAHWQLEFSDVNALKYGAWYGWVYMDFYDNNLFKETANRIDDKTIKFSVNFQGEIYDQCLIEEMNISNEWIDDVLVFTHEINVCVPKDYDGLVTLFYNKGLEEDDPQENAFELIDEDSVLYQLGPVHGNKNVS